jgi:cyclic pyranopterin phosphate synthase
VDRGALLSFEEIDRVARSFVRHGVRKLRLTGGEPLLRKVIEGLIAKLALTPDVEDLTLTTNGALLARKAADLAEAGLCRVTVSLDSMDDTVFMAMNDVGFGVRGVLDGVAAAAEAGLTPIKINMVVKRGVNDGSIIAMARHFKGSGHTLRFIEYMDVGTTNGWRLDDVVPGRDIVEMLDREFGIEPVDPSYRGEVAQRWRYRDGTGEVGVIASVTQPFCDDCTRARLSAEGAVHTCLFAARGTDLRQVLRVGASDEMLDEVVSGLRTNRADRYSETRSSQTTGLHKVEMSHIGGRPPHPGGSNEDGVPEHGRDLRCSRAA